MRANTSRPLSRAPSLGDGAVGTRLRHNAPFVAFALGLHASPLSSVLLPRARCLARPSPRCGTLSGLKLPPRRVRGVNGRAAASRLPAPFSRRAFSVGHCPHIYATIALTTTIAQTPTPGYD